MLKRLKRIAPLGILLVGIIVIFRAWFGFNEITAGDAPFYFDNSLIKLNLLPFIWDTTRLGQFSSLLHYFLFPDLPIKILTVFNIKWVIIERIVIYWPFLLINCFSSWYLLKTVLPQIKFRFLAPFIYLFNSYILMIIGGGQGSIALAYAISPLVIALFLRSYNSYSLSPPILSGLVFALQMAFEVRISALTIGIVVCYSLWEYRLRVLTHLRVFIIPFIICIGIHSYWILPTLFLKKPSYSPSFESPNWINFLSFADFSHTISLLHPNWPDNIFGKIYFMRPEFLGVPLLAYISLLFLKVRHKSRGLEVKSSIQSNRILFFTLLGLAGAFLAKGSNPPFGEAYLWLFKYFPGMSLFRDPTKFYLLIALSYSILIPFSVDRIITWISANCQFTIKKYIPSAILLLVIVYFLFLIRPAISGQLGGTFKVKQIPDEYLLLKDFLYSQNTFFRTLWLPKRQRYSFINNTHPVLSGEEFLDIASFSGVLNKLNDKGMKEFLSKASVRYIIIPYDSEGEIFLEDRKYDYYQRLIWERELDKVSWLKKVNVADKIAVYETPNYQDHFFIVGTEAPQIRWKIINPTRYNVEIKNANKPFNLIFSETYDELWQARVEEKTFPSQSVNNIFNSFAINKVGDFKIVVEFKAQKYIYYGLVISLSTLIVSFGFVAYFQIKKFSSK